MEEVRSGLVSNGAQAGPGDLPTLAKGCTGALPPIRWAPSISGCRRHRRGKLCTAPGEEKAPWVGIAIPAALCVITD